MERGFVGQGHALYECSQFEKALEWCEKGWEFLAKNKMSISSRVLKERMLFINELIHWSIEALPKSRGVKNARQLQLREKNVELAKELCGEES